MKCDNCKNRDFYGCCGFPLPHACDSCPCRGCDMCRDEQKVVAVYTEKIRRIEAAVGFTLEQWQQLYILNQGKVKFMDLLKWARGNHDRMIALRRAYALRYCLYQRQVNGRMLPKEALEQFNTVNIHRLEDAEISSEALWTNPVEFKYYVKNFYDKLRGTGVRLKKIIF